MLAVACWVNDRMFCETWSNLNFPYLHAFWHVLIFIASYTACVLFAYFDAKNQVKDHIQEKNLKGVTLIFVQNILKLPLLF